MMGVRSWGREIEPEENEIAFEAHVSEEPYQEWKGSPEPDYDAEEEMWTMAKWPSSKVTGDA